MAVSRMHIPSANVTLNGPLSGYRSTEDTCAHESLNSRTADQSRTVHDFQPERNRCWRDPKAIPTIASSACSWREIVLALFDTVLRDAEDMMLSLPYDDIREKTGSLARHLDQVALVEVEVEAPATRHRSGSRTSPSSKGVCSANEGGKRATPSGLSFTYSLASHALPKQSYELTVMTNAMCVASALSSVQSLRHARYVCYESLVAILVSYKQSLGHATEMQARRALTAALAAMDKIVS